MTRKHYLAIASILSKARLDSIGYRSPDGRAYWLTVTHDFADFFEQDNPGFDRKRFIAACMDGA